MIFRGNFNMFNVNIIMDIQRLMMYEKRFG